MTDEDRKRVARRQLEAFNRHNETDYVADIATSCVVIDIPSGEKLAGREGARDFFRRWSTAFPDGKTTIHGEFVSGDTVVIQFTGEGTQKGPLGPFPASNKRAKTEFCSVSKIDGQGKVTEITNYYDQLSLLMQLGHIPVPSAAGTSR
ncbi:MAG TPA: ester cyclase [Candidatus Dormibacteraeota bacterium]|nr:ester cyclase [Candidatus Dormibacteraeota bacterium]